MFFNLILQFGQTIKSDIFMLFDSEMCPPFLERTFIPPPAMVIKARVANCGLSQFFLVPLIIFDCGPNG